MISRINLFLMFLLFVESGVVFANIKVTILPQIAVDESNLNLFSTPIAYFEGDLFVVNVEPSVSNNTSLNLKTVVRKALPIDSRHWIWESHIIDNQTLKDKYHTQASIAIDKKGYLHAVYGMHNMPWQYKVSDHPGDISSFSFQGDELSFAERVAVSVFNKTPFPSIGNAAIPGNQITYPAFFYDKNNELYITYRFAVKPKRDFKDRGFSAGIARYDSSQKKWSSIGGEVQVDKNDADFADGKLLTNISPFAYTHGWTVYLPRLAFDEKNGMHVSWLWREGGAGGDTTHPSYAYSPADDPDFYTSRQGKYVLPVSEGKADWIGKPNTEKFDAISEITVDANYVYVVLHRQGETRELLKLDRVSKKWLTSEKMPYSASVFMIDDNGEHWAFATGLTVLHRKSDKESWKVVYKSSETERYGYPKVLKAPGENKFFIHTQSLSLTTVKIYKLEY